MYLTVIFIHETVRILGITWAYTIAICTFAFVGKFGGCTIVARYFAGFNWREAGAIGSLMSCKGFVLHLIQFEFTNFFVFPFSDSSNSSC